MNQPLPSNGSRRLLSPLRLGGSLVLSFAVLILIAIYTFEPDQFDDLVARLNPWWLLAGVGSVVARVVIGGLRLSYVSRGSLGLSDGIRAQLAWDFFSNVSPSAIGGGPVAALYVARDRNIPLGHATAIMLFTMLLDQTLFAISVPLLLLSALVIDVFPETLGTLGEAAFGLLFLGMFVWVVLFGYAMLFRPQLFEVIARQIFKIRWLRRFQERAASEMLQLRERSELLRKESAAFFANGLLMTLVVWISRFTLPLFIVLSVYGEVERLLMFVRTVALSLGSVILPTPGGSGGVEGLYAFLLGPLMPETLVAPTLLTWRILGFYVFLALGVYLSMHQVQQSIRRKRQTLDPSSIASTQDGQRELAEEVDAS